MLSARLFALPPWALALALAAGCGSSGGEAPRPDAADAGQDAARDTRDDASTTTMDPLPAFDSETVAHVRELVARGQSMGNRHDVVAKIGDSITESRAFLYECGDSAFLPGPHTDLMATVQYFTRTVLDADGFNSLTRGSLCAVGGWSSDEALEGGTSSALAMELDAIHPQWALVMYGTNDLERVDPDVYSAHMGAVVDMIEARGVVPALSTIPPRTDSAEFGGRVAAFNDALRALAHARHVPLMDYGVVMSALPGGGLGPDGVHPSVYMEGEMRTCDVSDEAVRFGYNARNLLALQMLARLREY